MRLVEESGEENPHPVPWPQTLPFRAGRTAHSLARARPIRCPLSFVQCALTEHGSFTHGVEGCRHGAGRRSGSPRLENPFFAASARELPKHHSESLPSTVSAPSNGFTPDGERSSFLAFVMDAQLSHARFKSATTCRRPAIRSTGSVNERRNESNDAHPVSIASRA